MARYEDVLVGGEGLRDYIQDLRSKLVEQERSTASSSSSTRCALVAERVLSRGQTSVAPFASTVYHNDAVFPSNSNSVGYLVKGCFWRPGQRFARRHVTLAKRARNGGPRPV